MIHADVGLRQGPRTRALEGLVGVTVLAVALIAAALLYFGYLLVIDTDRASSV